MSISKEEMIQSIYKKYGVMFADTTNEKQLLDAYAGKYSRIEIINISKRGKSGKFDRAELSTVSSSEITRLIKKYRNKIVPSGLSRKTLEDILLAKLNIDRLSDKELEIFGKFGRSSLESGFGIYTGLVPVVKKRMKEKDLERGKRIAKRYV